jgi:hypothetical protein
MRHRHLKTQRPDQVSLAAIDDIISRGTQKDWIALARLLNRQPKTAQKIARVCRANLLNNPRAQRYHFWKRYAATYFAQE